MSRSIWQSHRVHFASVLVFALVLGAAVQAADSAAAKLLLQKGWDKTAAARAIADQPELNAPPLNKDPFVLAAHWLVMMHQGRYDGALVSLDKFLEASQSDTSKLSALRAKAWIYAAKGDYSRAMIAARGLAQVVSPNPQTAEAAVPAAQADAIEFLGHLAGFLEKPAEKTADQNARTKFEAEVLARLDEPRKKLFHDAKANVLNEFQSLVGGAAEAAQKQKESAEAEKKQELERLSRENEKLSREKGQLDDKKRQLDADVQNKLADLQRQAAPLIGSLTAMQNQSSAMTQQLNQQQADVQQLQQQIANEQNAQVRQQLQNNFRQAQNTANNTQRQVNVLSGRIAATQRDLKILDQKIQTLGGGAMVQGKDMEKKQQKLDRDQQNLEKKQQRAERLKSTAGGKASLETQARAFRTYDEFPLEELRTALLEKLE